MEIISKKNYVQIDLKKEDVSKKKFFKVKKRNFPQNDQALSDFSK